MIEEGKIVLLAFPRTDLERGKLRPALVLRKLPGTYGDWLVCMISSRVWQKAPDFDEIIRDADNDFRESGLKVTSLIRVTRLAVATASHIKGVVGAVSTERLLRIRERLARWIRGTDVRGANK